MGKHFGRIGSVAAAAMLAVALPLVMAAPAEAALTCTKTWDAGNGTGPLQIGWFAPTNWAGDTLPGAGDVACIPVGFAASLGSAATVTGVIIDGSITVSSTLTVTSTEQSTIHDLTLNSGAVNGNATLTGTAAWNGGTLGGSGSTTVVAVGATLNHTNATDVTVGSSHVVRNEGTWNESTTSTSAQVLVSNSARLENAGTMTVGGPGRAFVDYVCCTSPYGIFHTVPGGTTTLSPTSGSHTHGSTLIENDGTLTVSSGTFNVAGGNPSGTGLGSDAGVWKAPTGAVLAFPSGSRTLSGSTFQGLGGGNEGTVRFNGASVTRTGGVGNALVLPVEFSAGTVGGLNFGRAVTWSGGTFGGSYPTTRVTLGGVVTASGSGYVDDGHTVQVDAGGTLRSTSGYIYLEYGNGADSRIVNSGLVEVTGTSRTWLSCYNACEDGDGLHNETGGVVRGSATAGNDVTSNAPFVNDGSVEAMTGTLSFDAGTPVGEEDSGSGSTVSGAAIEFGSGTRSIDGGSWSGTGAVRFSGAAVVGTSAATFDAVGGGVHRRFDRRIAVGWYVVMDGREVHGCGAHVPGRHGGRGDGVGKRLCR